MKHVYSLKFFTKSGLSHILAMPSEKAAFNILDQMRMNGAVIQVGRRAYRLDEMDNVWLDDKQIWPQQLTKPIQLDAYRRYK